MRRDQEESLLDANRASPITESTDLEGTAQQRAMEMGQQETDSKGNRVGEGVRRDLANIDHRSAESEPGTPAAGGAGWRGTRGRY